MKSECSYGNCSHGNCSNITHYNSDATSAMVMLVKLKNELQKIEDKLNNLNVQIDSVSELHYFITIYE